ncbi:MAG: bile acid:sodium symporter family protein [Bacteroidota bacterium]|nr:bile acid:sodium symporter family protein [Cytophagales bacterium]MCE2955605.1 bile acid:sodium symporter family protein [Flammeovirgaceae bacterium]MCZ8071987.1 bile acid:sodium symporter family protein [Cytophagales bacterium]
MQQSTVTTLFLPIALGIIMLGLGLSLTLDDFKRVTKYPKAITIALICQMLVLPIVCYVIARFSGLSAEMCVGLMLLAASPGGATANLYSHLANGDVALNITLTAVNSILALLTLPLIVNYSMEVFLGAGQFIPLPFSKVIEVFAIVLMPVSIGMIFKSKAQAFAAKMDKPVKIVSALLLLLIIVSVTIREKQVLIDHFASLGWPVLAFNVMSMAVGYFIPQLLGVSKRQSVAIGMEIGIHNGTLAIFIALNVIGNSMMSVPPALYSLLMFVTAAAFGFLVNLRKEKEQN